jgi:KipI family sensor histidine kinase inhibitor
VSGTDEARVVALGDGAVLIDLGPDAAGHGNRVAHALATAVRELGAAEPGYGSPVPGSGSVLVPVDPLEPGVVRAIERLAAVVRDRRPVEPAPDADGTPIEIPTRYGGSDGPDLEDVANATGLSPGDVVDLHAATEYRVLFLGFAPGFAYLGELPERLAVPRLDTPRARVPAGSVAIAARQTAIYPFDTPGGWRLIGRTDAVVWDATRDPPATLGPGRRVRFVPTGRRP